jgi:heat-inducible transcriptional repressor
MMAEHDLNEREALVLEAVVRTFVETAAPAASRTVARQFDLGVSPATIRNTMSDLTRKGYLSQPHASAGRMPTDKAYRYYVDTLMRPGRPTPEETGRIEAALGLSRTEERLLARAVKALSVVTQELGVGLAPSMEEGVLEKIDLVGVSRDRILIVLALRSGPVRTIFVEGERAGSDDALDSVAGFLNERLAGQTLREIRETYRDRLADSPAEHADLVNIFLEQAEGLFAPRSAAGDNVVLGPTAGLAAQPEFADREHLRTLLQLTEQRDVLAEALRDRRADGIVISIGGEHAIRPLVDFSMVTAEYEMGSVHGTIGVIGPTRMPYDRMVSLVEYTARLLSTLAPGD